MSNDTNRHINPDGSFDCSIVHNTFVCYHNISDEENNVKITISITEKGSEGTEKGEKEEI